MKVFSEWMHSNGVGGYREKGSYIPTLFPQQNKIQTGQ